MNLFYKITIVAVTFILISNVSVAQEYKFVMSKTFGFVNNISVVNDSTMLDGYLIFRIIKEKDTKDISNIKYFNCDIYFIEHLYQIETIDKWTFYNSYQLDYEFYLAFNDYHYFELPSLENYTRLKNLLNNYHIQTSDTISCCLLPRTFSTSLFFNSKLCFVNSINKLNIGYYIIPAKFVAGIIKNNCVYYGKLFNDDLVEEHIMENVKMFFPLSKNYYTEYLSLDFLENLGFCLSKWKPDKLLVE